jgi:NTE family protein
MPMLERNALPGIYAELQEDKDSCPHWIASMGAIIAGNPAEDRVRKLGAFWTTHDPALAFTEAAWAGWQHTSNWLSALRASLFGVPGQFRPRFMPEGRSFFCLYDLTPTRWRLERLVEFNRLNAATSASPS